MKVVKSPDTDTQLVKALGDLCTEALTDTETQAKPLVIRGYVNRVSKPAGTDSHMGSGNRRAECFGILPPSCPD